MEVIHVINDRIQAKKKVKLHLVPWCYPTHPLFISFGFVILTTKCHFRLLCFSFTDYDYKN